MEAFKRPGSDEATETEVLYMYSPLDDFVMNNLNTYSGKKLVTAETSDIAAGGASKAAETKGVARGSMARRRRRSVVLLAAARRCSFASPSSSPISCSSLTPSLVVRCRFFLTS
jgi:hypothetical protein